MDTNQRQPTGLFSILRRVTRLGLGPLAALAFGAIVFNGGAVLSPAWYGQLESGVGGMLFGIFGALAVIECCAVSWREFRDGAGNGSGASAEPTSESHRLENKPSDERMQRAESYRACLVLGTFALMNACMIHAAPGREGALKLLGPQADTISNVAIVLSMLIGVILLRSAWKLRGVTSSATS